MKITWVTANKVKVHGCLTTETFNVIYKKYKNPKELYYNPLFILFPIEKNTIVLLVGTHAISVKMFISLYCYW